MNESSSSNVPLAENTNSVIKNSSRVSGFVILLGLALFISLGTNAVLGYQHVLLQGKIKTLENMVADNIQDKGPAQGLTQIPSSKRTVMPSVALNRDGEDAGKALFLMIPESWQETPNPVVSQGLPTERHYTIETPNTGSVPGDVTLGRATFYVQTGIEATVEFNWDLESATPKKIFVAGMEAEQRQGFGGIGGSVFVKETRFITPGGTAVLFSLTTQDMNMLNDLEPQYEQLLETAKVE